MHEQTIVQLTDAPDPTIDFDDVSLPPSYTEIVNESGDLEKLFRTAYDHWLNTFNKTLFMQKLSEYIGLNPKERKTREDFKDYFKNLRKAGIILDSASRFCNQ